MDPGNRDQHKLSRVSSPTRSKNMHTKAKESNQNNTEPMGFVCTHTHLFINFL